MARVERTIDIQAPVERCYQLWARFEDFPKFMDDVKQVRQTGPELYRWVARTPRGQEYEWDARVTLRQENRLLAWESISGIGHSGSARFEPVDGGCRVQVSMELNPPGGELGEAFAKVSQDAEQRVEAVLRSFKQVAEEKAKGKRHKAG
ncbi:MAG: SRPBCC family protein [Chloroflexi bacterium]|nr:SRPBCC family protein [Chloroflexota bacterium]